MEYFQLWIKFKRVIHNNNKNVSPWCYYNCCYYYYYNEYNSDDCTSHRILNMQTSLQRKHLHFVEVYSLTWLQYLTKSIMPIKKDGESTENCFPRRQWIPSTILLHSNKQSTTKTNQFPPSAWWLDATPAPENDPTFSPSPPRVLKLSQLAIIMKSPNPLKLSD